MEVTARAPGKIILSGEHAVVHGSTAVAASINLYTYVTFRLPPSSECNGLLKLHLKDLSLEFSWPIARIKEAVANFSSHTPLKPKSCPADCLNHLASLVEEQKLPEKNAAIASGVFAFLWLYTCIHGYRSASVTVSSELPLGSGLGSSASLCVALSGALLALSSSVSLDCSKKDWLAFDEGELDLVNKWAFEGEKIIHGKPSGLDNTVSTYGNVIKFRSGELTRLKSSMHLKMMITNTRVSRNTKALVGGVSERTMRHPDAMASVFSSVDSISNEVSIIIQSTASDDITLTEKEEKLEELMEMNQGLLQCMGVSHTSIETVLRTTLKYKLSSKLTGAGGGGCVLTLLPTLLASTVVEKVKAELESWGFQCFTAGIGGNGVEIQFGCHNFVISGRRGAKPSRRPKQLPWEPQPPILTGGERCHLSGQQNRHPVRRQPVLLRPPLPGLLLHPRRFRKLHPRLLPPPRRL